MTGVSTLHDLRIGNQDADAAAAGLNALVLKLCIRRFPFQSDNRVHEPIATIILYP